MRDDRERLKDIADAIRQIEKYSAKGWDAFSQDELLQVWVAYHLQIIGEAARAISSKIKEKYPEFPWKETIGLRNVLIHHYFGLDLEVIWDIILTDLPPVTRQLDTMFREMQGDK